MGDASWVTDVQTDELLSDGTIALRMHGDHSFVLARSFGILAMQGGFALLEAGSVHATNRGNIMMKNLADMSFCMVFFLLYGYSLSLAPGNSFYGGGSKVGLRDVDRVNEYTLFFYHYSFATTTGTIVSGAVAGRMPFKTYIVLSALVTSIVYPAVVHWVWYTEGSGGWLYDCGFIDFAGAGVVHLVGGTAALVTAVMIGPRTGRYPAVPRWLRFLDRCHLLTRKALGERVSEIAPPEEDEMDVSKHSDVTDLGSSVDGPFDYIDSSPHGSKDNSRDSSKHGGHIFQRAATTSIRLRQRRGSNPSINIPRPRKKDRTDVNMFIKSDPVNLVFGTFVLAVGWLHFNTSGCQGVSLGRQELVGRIAVVTMVGASFGTVAGMVFSHFYYDGVIRVQEASTGTLSGLVAITAACGVITVWQSAISAFIGGLLSCAAALMLEAAGIDDPVSAVAVHGVGGFWGLLVVGLFNMGEDFGPQTGRLSHLKGVFPGGGGEQLGIQAYGGLAIIGWTTATTFVLVKVLDLLMGARVPLKIELAGLDGEEHGICADPAKFLRQRRARMQRRWALRFQQMGLRSKPPPMTIAAAAPASEQDQATSGTSDHGTPGNSQHGNTIFLPPTAENIANRPTPDPSFKSGDAAQKPLEELATRTDAVIEATQVNLADVSGSIGTSK